jgi:hypothetical protein
VGDGVYALWEGETVVYYGAADESLRAELREHFTDGTFSDVTHVQVEEATGVMTPRERQGELLLEYAYVTGRYPLYNLPPHLIAQARRRAGPQDVAPLRQGNHPVPRSQPHIYVVPRG